MNTAPARPPGRLREAGRRGFTLIEMLLATALSTVLVAALWTLLAIYSDLFTSGQDKAERSQLTRALLEQIADDLHSAIQDPIAGRSTETTGTAPLRRFGLFGGADHLRVDVLQVTPQQGNPVPVSDVEPLGTEPFAPRVPELRTVYYTFSPPALTRSDAGEGLDAAADLPGLVRRELDFETPLADESDELNEGPAPTVDVLALDSTTDSAQQGGVAPDVDSLDPADDSVTWVPEVVELGFRYFDGTSWMASWNSMERKALPVAVEVTIRMATSGEATRRVEPPALDETLGDDAAEPLPPEPDTPGARDPLCRLVVDMPGSPSYRKPKPPPAAAEVRVPQVRLSRPVARRIAPRRFPSGAPEPRAEDEWIRRGTP